MNDVTATEPQQPEEQQPPRVGARGRPTINGVSAMTEDQLRVYHRARSTAHRRLRKENQSAHEQITALQAVVDQQAERIKALEKQLCTAKDAQLKLHLRNQSLRSSLADALASPYEFPPGMTADMYVDCNAHLSDL